MKSSPLTRATTPAARIRAVAGQREATNAAQALRRAVLDLEDALGVLGTAPNREALSVQRTRITQYIHLVRSSANKLQRYPEQ